MEAKDISGNVYTKTHTISVDLAPKITASPKSCSFNGIIVVDLTVNKPATIYYTIDGTSPTTSSPVYTQSIPISDTTTLKYFAVDSNGKSSAIESQTYTYDPTVPSVTANPDEGTFFGWLEITLTPSEACTIYYSTDGNDPSTVSPVYTTPITISSSTTVKFMAKDDAGNQSSIYTKNYIIQELINPQIGSDCQNCHDSTAHDKPEDGLKVNHPNFDCNICHSTTEPRKNTTFAFDLNCSGCHTEAHNMGLYNQFPIQIPKFPGFLWTQPDPYIIYKGDPWTLNNGNVYDQYMIVYTNKRYDVTKKQVLDWYKQKIIEYGWKYNTTLYDYPDSFTMPLKRVNSNSNMLATIQMYGDESSGWALRILYGSK